MTTRSQVMSKIMQIVGKPGQKPAVIDRALQIFDAVVLNKPIPPGPGFNKSVPTLPPRERGEWTKRSDEGNERDLAEASSKKADNADNADERPANEDRNTVLTKEEVAAAFRILLAIKRLKTGGTITMKSQQLKRPLQGLLVKKQQQKPAATRTASQAAIPAKSTPISTPAPALVKADDRTRQPWGQNKRLWGFDREPSTIQSLPPAPSPAAAQPPSLSQNFRQAVHPARQGTFTGHQLAAIKVGLDPSTPGLSDMTINDMKERVRITQTVEARKRAASQGMFFGESGETYHSR